MSINICAYVYEHFILFLYCSLYLYIMPFVFYYRLCFKICFVCYEYCYSALSLFPFGWNFFSIPSLLICVYLVCNVQREGSKFGGSIFFYNAVIRESGNTGGESLKLSCSSEDPGSSKNVLAFVLMLHLVSSWEQPCRAVVAQELWLWSRMQMDLIVQHLGSPEQEIQCVF